MENITIRKNEGIQRMVEYGRRSFRTPENLNYYTEEDYKKAEKKFIKLCIIGQKCHMPAH